MRIFDAQAHMRPNSQQAERTVIAQSTEATVVGWHLLPGQRIEPHRHPHGQDTWVVLEGAAEYFLGDGDVRIVAEGDIVIAHAGEAHGARNIGAGPFIFVSVVAPAEAGYEPTEG